MTGASLNVRSTLGGPLSGVQGRAGRPPAVCECVAREPGSFVTFTSMRTASWSG